MKSFEEKKIKLCHERLEKLFSFLYSLSVSDELEIFTSIEFL